MKLELRRLQLQSPGAGDARRSWPERHSLLVRLTDAQGRAGLGEAAPLPNYSPDTLDEVEPALGSIDPAALQQVFDQSTARAALRAAAALLPMTLPSARLALESATLDLLGKQQGVAAPLLLGVQPGAERQLSFLLGPAGDSGLEARAEAAIAAGFRHFKLKLGAEGALGRELRGVLALRKRFGVGISLRVDANGALAGGNVATAWEALERAGLELFEEPGELPEALLGRLPLALDESLQGLSEAEVEAQVRKLQARGLVLKPTALGGLDHCWRLAERARDHGVDVVVSHCFEGPIGYRAACALALALPRGLAHGLGPHPGLGAFSAPSPSLTTWREPGLGDFTRLWP